MARLKQVKVSDVLLCDLLTVGNEAHVRCIEGLPEGTKPAGVWVTRQDRWAHRVSLIYEHASFDDVPDGVEPPEIRVVFETIGHTDSEPQGS